MIGSGRFRLACLVVIASVWGGAMRFQSPFPYFGGKSAIAHEVWARLGDLEAAS